jgi:hypothetical protein
MLRQPLRRFDHRLDGPPADGLGRRPDSGSTAGRPEADHRPDSRLDQKLWTSRLLWTPGCGSRNATSTELVLGSGRAGAPPRHRRHLRFA